MARCARSIDQSIGAQSGARQVHWQYAAVELPRTFRAADHIRLLRETEDSHVARPRAAERRDPMQRVAALKDLQVSRLEPQRPDQPLVAVEHGRHARVVLVGGAAQMRAVFKIAARLGVLDGQRHGVVVGVEMPGKTIAGLGQVDDDIGQRISIAIEARLAERHLDEGRKGRPLINGADDALRPEIVSWNEGVGAIVEPAQRMGRWQFRAIGREVGVGAIEVAVTPVGNPITFRDKFRDALGAHEVLQHCASTLVQLTSQACDQRITGRARSVNRISIGIDEATRLHAVPTVRGSTRPHRQPVRECTTRKSTLNALDRPGHSRSWLVVNHYVGYFWVATGRYGPRAVRSPARKLPLGPSCQGYSAEPAVMTRTGP
jgi:hypothetical protein